MSAPDPPTPPEGYELFDSGPIMPGDLVYNQSLTGRGSFVVLWDQWLDATIAYRAHAPDKAWFARKKSGHA